MKAAHHSGRYHHDARKVRTAADATPLAICWRDGLTLAQHPPHHNGNQPRWTAGHTIDGAANARPWLRVTERPPAGPWLAPEASTCNYSNGARRTNTQRANPQSRNWRA